MMVHFTAFSLEYSLGTWTIEIINAMLYSECALLTIPFCASSSLENARGSLCLPIFLSETNFRMLAFAVEDRPGTFSNTTAYAGSLLYFSFERKNVATYKLWKRLSYILLKRGKLPLVLEVLQCIAETPSQIHQPRIMPLVVMGLSCKTEGDKLLQEHWNRNVPLNQTSGSPFLHPSEAEMQINSL